MKRWRMPFVLWVLLVAAFSLLVVAADPPSWLLPSMDEVAASLADLPFDAFADDVSRLVLLSEPLAIIRWQLSELLGVRNDCLGLTGDTRVEAHTTLFQVILTALDSYDKDALPFSQRISYDALRMFVRAQLDNASNSALFWAALNPTHNSGLSVVESILEENHPSTSIDGLDDYIEILWQMRDIVEGWIEEVERSIEADVFLPRADLLAIRNLVTERTTHFGFTLHPYYKLGVRKLVAVPNVNEAYREEYLRRLADVVQQGVIPAFEELLEVIERVYDQAPSNVNWSQHPAWPAYYRSLLHIALGTELSPEAIHQMALAEVERITGEVVTLSANDDAAALPAAAVLQELSNTMHCLHAYTAGAMLEDAQRLYEDALRSAANLFHQLPRRAPDIRLAEVEFPMYEFACFDDSCPPVFSIPASTAFEKYALPSLVYHETVPGHHLQFETARAADVPLILQLNTWTGYTEGWATYTEQLAAEQGWHDNCACCYMSFLEDQLLTAYLTAIETGLFALGWDTVQAAKFLQPIVPAPLWQLAPVIEGFFHSPIQFTQYFVGRMMFLSQRERAEERMGDDFNLADFHQAVLAHGTIPLDLLETVVDEYVKREASKRLVP